MKTLFKWVGSKRWISKEIAKLVREEIVSNGKYYEPFVGAGSVLFELDDLDRQKIAYDIVDPLIETYNLIQQNPMGVWAELHKLEVNGLVKEEFLLRREIFNTGKLIQEKMAAYFIYLNYACYNGLWRTNKDGDFNVPFGDHKNLHLPDQGDFLQACQALQDVNFETINQPRQTLDLLKKDVKSGDVVFADPPYIDTYDGYDEFDYDMNHFHEELACVLWELHLHGATIIAMNSDNERTNRWYGAFCEISKVDRHQNISGTNKGRGEWSQILAVAK
jgi:DNA adenine methylase